MRFKEFLCEDFHYRQACCTCLWRVWPTGVYRLSSQRIHYLSRRVQMSPIMIWGSRFCEQEGPYTQNGCHVRGKNDEYSIFPFCKSRCFNQLQGECSGQWELRGFVVLSYRLPNLNHVPISNPEGQFKQMSVLLFVNCYCCIHRIRGQLGRDHLSLKSIPLFPAGLILKLDKVANVQMSPKIPILSHSPWLCWWDFVCVC